MGEPAPSLELTKTREGKIKQDRRRRKGSKATPPPVEEDVDKFMKLEQDLLPGIPNAVTLERITTKLPWTTVRTLSAVSPAWNQAIQDHLVHDARIRTHTADTFVIVNYTPSHDIPNATVSVSYSLDVIHLGGIVPVLYQTASNAIALYSWRDQKTYQLPPIPQVDSGIPFASQCITLDGKVYIIGGKKGRSLHLGSQDVYVLDLAGQKPWNQCASMLEGRHSFGGGVKDGKIYVFGGISHGASVLGIEVYDPKRNVWSARKPMKGERRQDLEVVTKGEEFYVYSGGPHSKFGLEAYHPVKNKWRTVCEDFGKEAYLPLTARMFFAGGKFYFMNQFYIYIYNYKRKSKKRKSLYSLISLSPICAWWRRWPSAVLALGDELLAVVRRDYITNAGEHKHSSCLVQGKGLGSNVTELVWEKVPCSLSFGGIMSPFLVPLQL